MANLNNKMLELYILFPSLFYISITTGDWMEREEGDSL